MDLQKVEELAKLMFDLEEIKIILSSDSDIRDFDDAFAKGRLLQKYEIRKSIYTMAKNGSTPAQKEWLQIVREHEIKSARK